MKKINTLIKTNKYINFKTLQSQASQMLRLVLEICVRIIRENCHRVEVIIRRIMIIKIKKHLVLGLKSCFIIR